MSLAIGALRLVASGADFVSISIPQATGNTGRVEYDTYVSRLSGFAPTAAEKLLSPGGRAAPLVIRGLKPAETAYVVVIATDQATGNTATSAQLAAQASGSALTAGSITAGTTVGTIVELTVTPATGGYGASDVQWHRSTTSGFKPTHLTALFGKNALECRDTVPAATTTYYYVAMFRDQANVKAQTAQQTVVVP